jgi:hypothetical protein
MSVNGTSENSTFVALIWDDGRWVPHPDVASFATLEPALSEAEGVGFHERVQHGLLPLNLLSDGAVPLRHLAFLVAQRRGPQHARFWRDGVERFTAA